MGEFVRDGKLRYFGVELPVIYTDVGVSKEGNWWRVEAFNVIYSAWEHHYWETWEEAIKEAYGCK